MGRINFLGSYSGIGMSEIENLMEAHRQPLIKMNNEKESIGKQRDAWKDINTRLKSLFEKLDKLKDPKSFLVKKSVSTGEDFVSMTPKSGAVLGDYKINIRQIATTTNIIGKTIDKSLLTDEDGKVSLDKNLDLDGNFKITNSDGATVEIEIGKEDSLRKIVEKINDAKTQEVDGKRGKSIGIKATIIDNKIVLSDEKTGERDISLEGSILSDLGLGDFQAEKQIGEKAIFTINGIEVERDSNKVDDVVEGISLNLKKAHSGDDYDVVSISSDEEKIGENIKEFIDQYNSTMSFIKEQTRAGDPEVKNSKGALYGDVGLNRLQDNLRKMLTNIVSRDKDEIQDISELGITTKDRYGELEFDADKLNEMLKEDPDKVLKFFYNKDKNGKETGMVSRLNEQIDGFISSKNGIIKSKNESFDKSLKDINERMDVFNERMDKKEAHYIKMFSALDTAMMQAESQLSWLVGQVDSMNAGK